MELTWLKNPTKNQWHDTTGKFVIGWKEKLQKWIVVKVTSVDGEKILKGLIAHDCLEICKLYASNYEVSK